MSVRAQHFANRDEFMNARVPGSFHLRAHHDQSGEMSFYCCCPCGCGSIAPLLIGMRFKPNDSPSWNFNGNLSNPTLQPSVNHVDHWHGWLTDGEWKVC